MTSNSVTLPLETEPAACEKNTWLPYFRPPHANGNRKILETVYLEQFLKSNLEAFFFFYQRMF